MNYLKLCKIFRTVMILIFSTTLIQILLGEELRSKNVIIFISDGCGYNHIDAASIYQYGEVGVQEYEKFPVVYAVTTFSASGHGYDPQKAWARFNWVKRKYTDSAASATAISTGVKTYNGYLAIDVEDQPLETIVQRFERLGKSTGVITTVTFANATPAGFVAHNTSRHNYLEIVQEMIFNSSVDVIMGCGHPLYDDNSSPLDSSLFDYTFVGGESVWDELVEGSAGNDENGDGKEDFWTLIQDRAQFQVMASGPTPKRVIGIPRVHSTLQQSRAGDEDADPFVIPLTETVPTLTEMTLAALNVLDDDQDGFFLMVEGGAVDWASHGNQLGRMVEEEIDFNSAVDAVIEWVEKKSSWTETLVIVTADHECGYLTGTGSGPDQDDPENPVDPVWNPIVNNGRGQLPGVEWHSTGHTNSLVPIFAKGLGSEHFQQFIRGRDPVRGEYIDNTDIAKVIFLMFD